MKKLIMKQYTTPKQTAKLIELGFEKPGSIASVEPIYGMGGISVAKAYSIGELIEMLDNIPNNNWDFTRTSERIIRVEVHILPKTKRDKYFYRVSYRKELIDALYDMCVLLKEEGVI